MRSIFIIILCSFVSGCFSGEKKWSAKTPLQNLGYHLYFEKKLSKDNTVSCNTCHDVTKAGSGTDNLPTSVGINGQKGGRNAPTVLNATFLSVQFWDGRAKDLAEQAKGPITNPIEMGMESHDVAIAKIRSDEKYKKLFKEAFPKEEDPIHIDNLAKAIASFEMTLTTLNSPFDQKKMSAQAQRGYQKFQETGCVSCHSGDHFSGPKLPVGSGFFMKFPTFANQELEKKYGFTKDPGRFEVTHKESDRNMWRVPTLRNVEKTSPYFHNGKVTDLKEAVQIMAKLQLNKDLSPEDTDDIVEFLKALSGTYPEVMEPK